MARLVWLKVWHDKLASEIAELQKRIACGEPSITPQNIEQMAILRRDKLHNGPAELKQA